MQLSVLVAVTDDWLEPPISADKWREVCSFVCVIAMFRVPAVDQTNWKLTCIERTLDVKDILLLNTTHSLSSSCLEADKTKEISEGGANITLGVRSVTWGIVL